MAATVYDKETQKNKPANLQDALTYLNEFLAFDGYEIVRHGKGYDVVDKILGEIVVDVKLEPSHLSHAFIMEQTPFGSGPKMTSKWPSPNILFHERVRMARSCVDASACIPA